MCVQGKSCRCALAGANFVLTFSNLTCESAIRSTWDQWSSENPANGKCGEGQVQSRFVNCDLRTCTLFLDFFFLLLYKLFYMDFFFDITFLGELCLRTSLQLRVCVSLDARANFSWTRAYTEWWNVLPSIKVIFLWITVHPFASQLTVVNGWTFYFACHCNSLRSNCGAINS